MVSSLGLVSRTPSVHWHQHHNNNKDKNIKKKIKNIAGTIIIMNFSSQRELPKLLGLQRRWSAMATNVDYSTTTTTIILRQLMMTITRIGTMLTTMDISVITSIRILTFCTKIEFLFDCFATNTFWAMLNILNKPLFVTSLPNRGFINLASPASALSQREPPKWSRESQSDPERAREREALVEGKVCGKSLWLTGLPTVAC